VLKNRENSKLENNFSLNKMKNKKYHIVRTVPKTSGKNLYIDTLNTHILNCSIFRLATGTSIKINGVVKLFIWA
jgi:hypothetical protein